MPPYFFLSRAQADNGPTVRRFFDDLSDSIRIQAGLPLTEVVGCCEAFEQNANDREDGLRTTSLMIALLSPDYFRDKKAGREWKIFEIRKAKSASTDKEALMRSIIPISWLPYSGPIPSVISQTPIYLNGGHRREPVGTMLRSRGNLKEYAEFVNSLAGYIIDATASFQLPELDSIPEEVSNVFEDLDELVTNSQTTNPRRNQNPYQNIKNVNQLFIDGAFVKRVAEQMRETADRPTPSSTDGISLETTQSRKTGNGKYSVFVIDDDPECVNIIKTTGDFSLEFDVKTYENSTVLLNDVSTCLEERREPDLFVVNPELPGETPGVNLLQALLGKKNLSSAILAISRNADLRSSLESAGIHDLVAILPKPFTSADLLPPMRHWAQIGREKRDRRGRSNMYRPVFLSYSSKDDKMASQICKGIELRSIGVWYTRESLDPGDEWRIKVSQGLARAEVFIALISDNYPNSVYCQAELGIILDRLQKESGHLLVIPVLYNGPVGALQDPQVRRCRNQQEVKISDDDWQNGFQAILRTVQNFLKGRRSNQSAAL